MLWSFREEYLKIAKAASRTDYLPDRSFVLALLAFSWAIIGQHTISSKNTQKSNKPSSYTKNSCKALPAGTIGKTGTF